MFDYLKSSYDLGPQFTDVILQTKDIEDFDIGGSLSNYWISPDGLIWVGDYTGTSNFEIIEEGDPEHNDKFLWRNHRWRRTGVHGKWHVHPITKYITIYPAQWDGAWEDWPRLRLHFKSGQLQDFQEVTGQ
jgi:hypothetical protein